MMRRHALFFLLLVALTASAALWQGYTKISQGHPTDTLLVGRTELGDTNDYQITVSNLLVQVKTNQDVYSAPKTRSISTTAPITGGGDLSADRTLSMHVADDTHDGYLSAADHAAQYVI